MVKTSPPEQIRPTPLVYKAGIQDRLLIRLHQAKELPAPVGRENQKVGLAFNRFYFHCLIHEDKCLFPYVPAVGSKHEKHQLCGRRASGSGPRVHPDQLAGSTARH